MEWKERLITTDIDRLLTYLTEEGQASVSAAAEDLEVTEERIDSWADALVDAGLVERSYTTTKGKILEITDKEKAEEHIEDVKEETQDEVEAAIEETTVRKQEIKDAWETISDLLDAIEEKKDVEERIEEDLEELQEEEVDINDEDDEIEQELLETLEDIEDQMGGPESAEEEVEAFRNRKEKIQSNLKAIKKLEEHRKKLRRKELKHEQQGYKCEYCDRSFDTERGLHVHQAQKHPDKRNGDGGLLRKISRLKPW